MTAKPRLLFVVESGTDVRLVEGLAPVYELELACRRIAGGVEVSRPPGVSVKTVIGPASRVAFALWLLARLLTGRDRPDLVLVQGYALAALASNIAGRARGFPGVMLVCSPVELYYRSRKDAADPSAPYRWFEAAGLASLARINAHLGKRYVVLSQHLADVVASHGTKRPIHVVPVYGVDTTVFSPFLGEDRDSLRTRLGLPVGLPLLLFSSRVAPEKDAETLLLALKLLVARGRLLRLLNRSGGFRRFQLHAAALGVGEFVDAADALPPSTELADLYRAVDLCIQASRQEGLGFSPLEALATGTPVIASAVGGLKETIIADQTGWTYQPGNAEQLASVIEEALTNAKEAARRAANGRTMVLERFERNDVFKQFVQVLDAASGD